MLDSGDDSSTQCLLNEIDDLKRQLADRLDYEERLETQAKELVGLAEGLDGTRNELQNLIHQRDRFFSIIAHDLRSPFTALLGFTELLALQARTMTRDSLELYANFANDAGQQAHKLLENLLEWSQLQTGSTTYAPENLPLTDAVNTVIALFAAPANAKEITLQAGQVAPDVVTGDPQMIDAILRNLVNNAIKFTPDNGAVTVSATKSDGAITLAVTDTGIGMEADTIARLFKLDDKVSTPGTNGEPSTGLGLQLCHELAMLHDGPITIDSAPGKGSTFSFQLPLA
ncbi:MAG: HAMP domain-containing histidine kinase [Rhodospirillaceae bacterium]|nr:HAMP domain-containing histidine kinase [Rhodospirillaceae bacterium]